MGALNFSIYSNCTDCGQYKKVRRFENNCYSCYQRDLRKTNNETIVSVRIPKSDHKRLKKNSIKQKISMAELLRTYFCWGLENDYIMWEGKNKSDGAGYVLYQDKDHIASRSYPKIGKCITCGKIKELKGRICQECPICYQKRYRKENPKIICSECGKQKPNIGSKEKPICSSCSRNKYERIPEPKIMVRINKEEHDELVALAIRTRKKIKDLVQEFVTWGLEQYETENKK